MNYSINLKLETMTPRLKVPKPVKMQGYFSIIDGKIGFIGDHRPEAGNRRILCDIFIKPRKDKSGSTRSFR